MDKNKRILLKRISLLPLINFGANANAVTSNKVMPTKSEEYILNNLGYSKLIHNEGINIYRIEGGKKRKRFGYICYADSDEVNVSVESDLKDVKSISLFLDKPELNRIFRVNFFGDSIPFIASRYKILKRANLIAVVETKNALYYNSTYMQTEVQCCVSG